MKVFDIEANGLLLDVTQVHCLVVTDFKSGEALRFRDVKCGHVPAAGTIADGLDLLDSADEIGGHGVLGYDCPALKKLKGWEPKAQVRDSLVYSRLLFPDMKDRDFRQGSKKRGKWIPRQMYGRHSLEAWGYRLGEHKGDFKGPWDVWGPEMEDYCVQDTITNLTLFKFLLKRAAEDELSPEAVEIEHAVARIISRQVQRGFKFDTQKAVKLYAELVGKRDKLVKELCRGYFRPFYTNEGEFTPKRDNAKAGYVAGVPLSKVKLTDFNPGSRMHIADRLTSLYGWKPKERTDDGRPKVDETVLNALPYPPVPLLVEYLTVEKRVGQLAEGKEALIKAERDGVIHGSVNTNAAVTGRMTHAKPNVSQVPAVYSLYGKEFRSLFIARPGYVLVGCDAEGLELRDLAHYMARWDSGAYAETVVSGKKENKTDVHSVTQKALEFNSRDNAKTWMYAFLYGAGDYKLGTIVLIDMGPEAAKKYRTATAISGLGKRTRALIAKNLPALSKLVKAVKAKAREKGYLIGLDGRRLHVRSEHAALNTLLQSAGAVGMKKALIIADQELQKRYRYGDDYEFVANIHDEWQVEARPKIAKEVGKVLAESIRLAGEHFKFRCPLSGDFRIGPDWSSTH